MIKSLKEQFVKVEVNSAPGMLSVASVYHIPPYLRPESSKTLQWMPDSADSTKVYTDYVFSYTFIPMVKLTLSMRHSKGMNNGNQ